MNIQEKMLQRYMGFHNPRDEYQKNEMYHVLANGTIYIFGLVTLFLLISLCWDVYYHQFSAATPLLLFIQTFIFLFTTLKGNKIRKDNQTMYIESYDEKHYNQQISVLKRQMIYVSIFLFTANLVVSSYVTALTDNHMPRLDIFDILGTIVEISILVTFIYLLAKMMMAKRF
ncbi:hypothetical protein [Macrococcus equipercicus]|uniref:DUF3278 domain-containing protein n=1 Tax=Macrococcus equipercicus TaxID=69967 RepID=A0A9Q9F3E2_9STAP|nr:hypothetical protein [Macrococcus equipercicus]UTH13874.1 hypothetical protein KFV11_00415 [Macrococcus equipercicus]